MDLLDLRAAHPSADAPPVSPAVARILVVDDDEDDWALTRAMFAAPLLVAYDPVWVRDRANTVAALLSGEYAAALVDHRLGGDDGLELMREAIRLGTQTPMIMLTGIEDPLVDAAAAAAGAADYLVKGSVDARQLERSLRYAIAEAEGRRALVRAQEAVAAIEIVGRTFASEGPTPAALEQVMNVMVDRVGYQLASIYLGDSHVVRLGAQRGYDVPYESIAAGFGVIGRVMGTHELAFVADTSADSDYVSAVEAANAEICAPLIADGEFLGVLNIESTADRPFDATDVRLVSSVADRIAAAIALGRERLAIGKRAEMLASLNRFSAQIADTLASDDLERLVVERIGGVIDADVVALTLRGPDGGYAIRAIRGAGPALVGAEIRPGDGLTGRAIKERRLLTEHRQDRSAYPESVRALDGGRAVSADVYTTIAVPLIRGEDVLGGLLLAREDLADEFTDLEREGLSLAAGQIALAVANADLHGAVAQLAIRDGLTGIHNRRHFDEQFARLLATRSRVPAAERVPMTAILFDLDNFGSLNKLHGHQTGDEVLRKFGRLLAGRVRSTDLVARYGGEEFVVILDRATGADAERLANEIREALQGQPTRAPDGETLVTTVSAGCATLGDNETAGEALLELADVGLTLAKRGGRNRVVRV